MIKLAKIWLSIWVKNQFIWVKISEQILGWRPASCSEDCLLNMNRADIGRNGNRTKAILARFRSAILYLFSDFG